jgi:ammonia channel protein AmtB
MWLIATTISKTIGFKVSRGQESVGLDTAEHAESAYDLEEEESMKLITAVVKPQRVTSI